jgi:hypothetical protein
VADYAFKFQVAAYHAGWAVAIHDGNNNATACACQFCEREGLTERIIKAGRVAWSAYVAANVNNQTPRPAADSWFMQANDAARVGAQAEARAILAGLEAARNL